MLPRLRKESLLAELASLESILRKLSEDDIFSRAGYESRIENLKTEINIIDSEIPNEANAALIFSGSPVIGSLGIEAEFSAAILGNFQEVISKLLAQYKRENISRVGPIPGKDTSRLFITNILHGSFGFELKEIPDQFALSDTKLKKAVEDATNIIVTLGQESDKFEEEIAHLNTRTYESFKSFFTTIHNKEALFKIASSNITESFDKIMVERAFNRITSTKLEEQEMIITGKLLGILPDSHRYEFEHESIILRGPVGKGVDDATIEEWTRKYCYTKCSAQLSIKKITSGTKERIIRTLLDVEPYAEDI